MEPNGELEHSPKPATLSGVNSSAPFPLARRTRSEENAAHEAQVSARDRLECRRSWCVASDLARRNTQVQRSHRNTRGSGAETATGATAGVWAAAAGNSDANDTASEVTLLLADECDAAVGVGALAFPFSWVRECFWRLLRVRLHNNIKYSISNTSTHCL